MFRDIILKIEIHLNVIFGAMCEGNKYPCTSNVPNRRIKPETSRVD